MIVGIILAAGESKRMGEPKALLKIGDQHFINRIASVLEASRLDLIYAVLGDRKEKIEPLLSRNVNPIHNPSFQEGQISSLKAAVEKIQYENCDAAIVTLVDHPLISAAVVERLIESFYQSKKRIIVPTHAGKRGHPVLYSREVFPQILAAPLDRGAKTVRLANLEHTLEVAVNEPGVLIDIDTPEEYERHIAHPFSSAAAR